MVSLLVAVAAGCDTMEQDVDGSTLSINNEPTYVLPGVGGFIDLPARVIAPGKVKVEITGPTQNGALKDLGKGLLQYIPLKGTSKDLFRFRVLSDDNRVLGEDSIGIIVPPDTTNLPCKNIYSRPDTVLNVTGPVTIDVATNDYACLGITISVQTAAEFGTATMVGNKIKYVPNSSFTGEDRFIYRATVADPAVPPAFAFVRIFGPNSSPSNPETPCTSHAMNDLFFKPLNDSSVMWLNVLANDTLCADSTITITQSPRYGTAVVYNSLRKISYRNPLTENRNDTLMYRLGAPGNAAARVIIKRQ